MIITYHPELNKGCYESFIIKAEGRLKKVTFAEKQTLQVDENTYKGLNEVDRFRELVDIGVISLIKSEIKPATKKLIEN
ncbi:MAG: hypothetical protein HC907_35165 [Richelia sp. SM1_7_0]|nr:hypothetical protein [Richelia sp. SM1_7_0]